MMPDQNEVQAPPTLFNDKLLELISDARRTCSNMWPDSDSPASAMETVHKGVEAGLDEMAAANEMLEELGPQFTKAMQAAKLWKQMADMRAAIIQAMDQNWPSNMLSKFKSQEAEVQKQLDEMVKDAEEGSDQEPA